MPQDECSAVVECACRATCRQGTGPARAIEHRRAEKRRDKDIPAENRDGLGTSNPGIKVVPEPFRPCRSGILPPAHATLRACYPYCIGVSVIVHVRGSHSFHSIPKNTDSTLNWTTIFFKSCDQVKPRTAARHKQFIAAITVGVGRRSHPGSRQRSQLNSTCIS